ncbi:MAG: CIA30 family protein [candidate division Zixibacteria bacterium]|nr:CIA30 family protein [candidate division Zixibacteria bacterium]
MRLLALTIFGIMFFSILAGAENDLQDDNQMIIYDFNSAEQSKGWRVINDGVMGGLSSSTAEISDSGTLVFTGNVSLKNNGGFASVRGAGKIYDFGNHEGIRLRIKGDGKRYAFTLNSSKSFGSPGHKSSFDTENGTWNEIELPLDTFKPVLRWSGQLRMDYITSVGFLISDEQEGSFRLEVDWIEVY